MGFFPELDRPKTVARFDQQCADKLRKALVEARPTSVTTFSRKKWVDPFRLLRTEDKFLPGDVETVLDWYCANVLKIKPQHINNGAHFRKCFKWIKDEMDKAGAALTVSKDAQDMARRFSHYHWPKGSGALLAVTIERTLQSWVAFRKRVAAFCEANPERVKEGKYERTAPLYVQMAHYLKRVVKPIAFTESWMNDVWQTRGMWDDWNGNMTAEAWDGELNNKRFNQTISTLLTSFAGSDATSSWERIKKELSQ